MNSYRHVLKRLHFTSFKVLNPYDVHRIDDAVSLWKQVTGFNDESIPFASILEVMVALAFRIENDIMSDPRVGDQTYIWFWMMFRSLGMDAYDDLHYEARAVRNILSRFNNREYSRNGSGSLFTVYGHPEQDMRTVEIWYQMQLALREYG